MKLLVDVLVQVGKCNSIADVPAQVSKLLQQCNKKSDITVEREILDRYLSSTKSAIDKQINDMINTGKSVQSVTEDQKQQIQEQLLGPSTVKEEGDEIAQQSE